MGTGKKKINKRAIVSITLFVAFITMFVSAFIANKSTQGSAVWHTWIHIHGYSGMIFTITSIFHIVYNWRALKRYMMGK